MIEDTLSKRVDTAARLADLRRGKGTAEAPPAREDAESEVGESYSLISADRRQKIMLELRFRTGNAKALAYSYLVAIDFNPSTGIVMDFSGQEVMLTGRNLEPLFAALCTQRVAVVTELDDLHAEATLPPDATVVTRIDIVPRR